MLKFSGIDWALFVYNKLSGLPLPPVDVFTRDVRVIRPLSDFLAFRDLNRDGTLTWREWMASIAHRQHFQYFRWTDPMPSLVRIYPMLTRHLLHDSINDSARKRAGGMVNAKIGA